jgi:hypothetical protein
MDRSLCAEGKISKIVHRTPTVREKEKESLGKDSKELEWVLDNDCSIRGSSGGFQRMESDNTSFKTENIFGDKIMGFLSLP